MSSYRSIQEQSGAVPDSNEQIKPLTIPNTKAFENDIKDFRAKDRLVFLPTKEMGNYKHAGTCQQSGCRNTFLNQEGYCFPHHTARNTEGMFTNEERK